MPSKEYLQALVKLLKPLVTRRDHDSAKGKAGGIRGSGVDAEDLVGVARITPRSIRGKSDEELFDLQELLFTMTRIKKKEVYSNAHKFIQDELRRRGHDLEFNLTPGDVHVNSIVTEIYDDEVTMPFPNESACRIAGPGQFSRFRRNNSTSPHTIIGFKADGGSSLQSFRYPTSSWTVDRARAHCERHGGSFSPATKEHEADE